MCICFGKVTNVKFDSLFIRTVLYSKIEPIDIPSSIRVNPQKKIKLRI